MFWYISIFILLLSTFWFFYKFVSQKKHSALLEIACVYLLYLCDNKEKEEDTEIILMNIFNMYDIPIRQHYFFEVKLWANKIIDSAKSIEAFRNYHH
ncbi:hypothetical protein I3300191I4_13210 [Megasphaera elsdenii]